MLLNPKLSYSLRRLRRWSQNEDYPNNEQYFKNEDDLKNEVGGKIKDQQNNKCHKHFGKTPCPPPTQCAYMILEPLDKNIGAK